MLERHEIEYNRREQDDLNAEIAFESFKPDAIAQIVECFKKNGDIQDMLNDIYLQADGMDIDLEVKDLTCFTYEAALKVALENKDIMLIRRRNRC